MIVDSAHPKTQGNLRLNMKPLRDCLLYTFIDTAYLKGRRPDEIAKQLCDGGSDLIQLRSKTSAPDEICQLAEIILPITDQAGVGLVINDYPGIALKVGAFASHLGQAYIGRTYVVAKTTPGIGSKSRTGRGCRAWPTASTRWVATSRSRASQAPAPP